MKVRKLLSILLTLTMVLSLLPMSAMAASYEDAEGHWAEEAINRWSDYGIVTGDERGFRPNDNMTRAEAAKVLSELFGLTSTAGATAFTDVPADAWYANYIAKANAAGIMGGVGDNRANPNGTLTRETFFVMFARGLGLKEQTTTKGVAADGDSWANGYINALTDKGYVQGMDGKVNALAIINRASVMSLLNQTIAQYINESGTVALNADKGIVLVNAKNVTLTGATNADIVIAKGASNGSVAFSKATVNGAVTVQADNAKVTADSASKLAGAPVVNGAGSTYTAANGTVISGGAAGTPGVVKNTTLGGDDPSVPPTEITSASQIVGEKNAAGRTVVNSDLIIGEGLGNGDITLDGVEIYGNLIVRGGGSSSITLTNVKVHGQLQFDKQVGGAPAHVKVTDAATAIDGGTAVVAGSEGAKITAPNGNDGVFGDVTASADIEVAGYAKVINLSVNAETGDTVSVTNSSANSSVTTLTVGSGNASIQQSAGTIGAVVAANADGGTVALNNNVTATLTATGSDTKLDIGSGVTAVTVSGGSATIENNALTNAVINVSGGAGLTVADSASSSTTVNVTGSGSTVAVANGATISAVNVASGASNTTIASEGAGGTVTAVNASANVAIETDVTTVTVPAGASAQVKLDEGAAVTTVDAKGTTTIASGSNGGTVGEVKAAANVNVSGADATVQKVTVETTDGSAVTVNVTNGNVDEIEAKTKTTVSGTSSGNVANVKATAAVSVDSAVVDTVTADGASTVIEVKGSDALEIDTAATTGTVTVTSAAGEGNSTDNITVTKTTGSATVTLDGEAATIVTKPAAPTVTFTAKDKVSVTFTAASGAGTVTVYADSAKKTTLGTAKFASGASSATVTLDADKMNNNLVYASLTISDTESALGTGKLAKFAAKQAEITVAAGVWGESALPGITVANLFDGSVDSSSVNIPSAGSSVAKEDSGTITIDRSKVAANVAAFNITVNAQDSIGQTASVTIKVGATTTPKSDAPVATLNYSTDKTNKQLQVKVTEAQKGGTITVYATADATEALATATASDATTQINDLDPTKVPGNVYVVYTGKVNNTNITASDKVASVGYVGIKTTEAGAKGIANIIYDATGKKVLTNKENMTAEDSAKTATINFASLVEGGSGKYAYKAETTLSWVKFGTDSDSAKATLTLTWPATAVAATPVVVTVTDTVSNESVTFDFTVEVTTSVSTAISTAALAVSGKTFKLAVDLAGDVANTWAAGDIVKLYESEKATSPIATITVTADNVKSDVSSTDIMTFDLVAAKIKLTDNVYVTYTQANKTESAKVESTGYEKMVVKKNTDAAPTVAISGTFNTAISKVDLTVDNALQPVTWTAVALPDGLTWTATKDTGAVEITGTPKQAAIGTNVVEATATDANGAEYTVTLTITVAKKAQNAPTGVTAAETTKDGYSILSTTEATMEYSTDGGTTWRDANATSTRVYIGVKTDPETSSGSNDNVSVLLRYKETATLAASANQTSSAISVAKFAPLQTIKINSISADNNNFVVGESSLPTITLSAEKNSSSVLTEGDALKYQWYKSDSAASMGEAISGATNTTYTLLAANDDNTTIGTFYYTCVVTNSKTGYDSVVATSDPVAITVTDKKVSLKVTVTTGTGASATAVTGIENSLTLWTSNANGDKVSKVESTATAGETNSANVYTFSNVTSGKYYVVDFAGDSSYLAATTDAINIESGATEAASATLVLASNDNGVDSLEVSASPESLTANLTGDNVTATITATAKNTKGAAQATTVTDAAITFAAEGLVADYITLKDNGDKTATLTVKPGAPSATVTVTAKWGDITKDVVITVTGSTYTVESGQTLVLNNENGSVEVSGLTTTADIDTWKEIVVRSGGTVKFAQASDAVAVFGTANLKATFEYGAKLINVSTEIIGTSSAPTNANYLQMTSGSELSISRNLLTISKGEVIVPAGKSWDTFFKSVDTLLGAYNVTVAEGATLTVNGTMNVGTTNSGNTSGASTLTIADGGTLAIAGNGKLSVADGSHVTGYYTAVENAYTAATEKANDFKEEHYNKHSNGQTITADDKYYVRVATGNMSGVTSIKINNEVHSTGDTFSLSAGMNAMVTMNYFEIINKELYVAFPVVLFDMLEKSTIEANGVTLNYAKNESEAAEITNVRGKLDSGKITVTTESGEANTYTVTHNNTAADEWLEIVIAGLTQDNVMVTKKVYTDKNNSKTTDYGFTGPDKSGRDNTTLVLAFYPFGWSNTSAPTGRDGVTCEYQAYLVGTGKTAKLTLNLKCAGTSS